MHATGSIASNREADTFLRINTDVVELWNVCEVFVQSVTAYDPETWTIRKTEVFVKR